MMKFKDCMQCKKEQKVIIQIYTGIKQDKFVKLMPVAYFFQHKFKNWLGIVYNFAEIARFINFLPLANNTYLFMKLRRKQHILCLMRLMIIQKRSTNTFNSLVTPNLKFTNYRNKRNQLPNYNSLLINIKTDLFNQ